jgi:uncharacterized membrane protein YphA (DoxX/SURF4 family)
MRKLALRFAFTYFFFVFLVLSGFPSLIPGMGLVLRQWAALWHRAAVWLDANLLHLPYPVHAEDGALTNTAFGVAAFLLYLAAALIVAVLWTALDRRANDDRLHAWLRVMLRLTLAPMLIRYGMIKLIPTQMIAPPPPGVLGFAIGDLIPNHLLWWTIGASPVYESFLGLAELTGGLLLLLPRTTLLGALLSAANMLVVFVMNMAYDIPVKLPSLHFFVMAVLLVLPDAPRLADLFLRDRRVEPASRPSLFSRPILDRGVQVVVFLLGVYAIVGSFQMTLERKAKMYPPRPPLFGAWSVETFRVEGRDVPGTDASRWDWLTVQRPGRLGIETMSGALQAYDVTVDPRRGRIVMERVKRARPGGPPQVVPGTRAELSFRTPDADTVLIDGPMQGRQTHVVLRRAPLTQRGFRWIAPP